MSLLLAATPGFAAADDSARPAAVRPRIEVCFVLDTTGSMGGLIEGAKQKIWSIANEIVAARPTPVVRFSLVAYRDRGDDFVTRVTPLTEDLDAIYAELQGFRAAGGGDTPEAVNQALHDAVHQVRWDDDRDVLKIIYLVGDAPPHAKRAGEPDYASTCQEAVARDLIINTVQCGSAEDTRVVWTEIARRGEGRYVALAQSGNMVASSTPFDDDLVVLNRELGKTIVPYGTVELSAFTIGKQRASEAAPAAVVADRLAYNARAGGVVVQGGGDLIDTLNAGEMDLAELDRDLLPAGLRDLSDDELRGRLESMKAGRAELQEQIGELTRRREAYLAEERKRTEASARGDAFDEKVAEILREQAAQKGIRYE